MELTSTDKLILNSYIPVIHDLAAYLGSSFEIVLHSLEDYEHSVIEIVNGEHTGRTIGSPITDLALDMLEALSKGQTTSVYFTRRRSGEPLKSSTIAIRGEHDRIIGLICINMHLNTPLCDVLDSLRPSSENEHLLYTHEIFASDVHDLVESALEEVREYVLADATVLPSNKNKVIVEELYRKGIFQMKNAVTIVASLLNISKNTVYMHIRNYRSSQEDAGAGCASEAAS